jgi:hypothetical protein
MDVEVDDDGVDGDMEDDNSILMVVETPKKREVVVKILLRSHPKQ